MKKIVFLGMLVVLFPAIGFAQEKVEAPVWNVGDKWAFTGDGSIEVVKEETNGYILNFSDRICILEGQGFNKIIFHKTTLNRMFTLEGDKRTKYARGYKKLLDFPFSLGKQCKDAFSSIVFFGPSRGPAGFDYSETFTVLGWEDVTIRAGNFKAIKLEYRRITTGSSGFWRQGIGVEVKNHYWYSPMVKYFVKCQYDKSLMELSPKELFNWDLTSFQLKK